MTTQIPFFSLRDLGLASSSSQLLQQWLVAMQLKFPGYVPSQGNLEYIQAQIFAAMASDLALLCSTGSDALFEAYGTDLLGLPYEPGSVAIAVVRVTASDTLGHTLAGGTSVLLTATNGTTVGFLTGMDLVIAPGASAGQVTIASSEPGLSFNGAGAPVELNSAVDWVAGITVVTNAADGTDPEDQAHYLNRLRSTLQLLAPRPITASDYATMALDFEPAPATDQQLVGRASSIDGYDPNADTYGNERMVCVCITDDDGDPLDSDTLAAVKAWFQLQRELNFIVNVVSPNYSTIYVTVTVKATIGWQASVVQAGIQSALLAFLAPANFGLPSGSTVGWVNYTTIWRSKLETVVQQVQGVDYVVNGALAFGLSSSPTNTTGDLSLPGPFPLPMSSATSIPLAAITVL